MKKHLCLILFVSTLLVSTAFADDAQKLPVIKITDYNSFTVAGVLDANVGKEVEVTLSTGATFKGKLVGVGARAIHLGKLSGRDFYDAVIDKGAIVAVALRVRER